MAATAKAVLAQALDLDADERADLAFQVLRSLHGSDSPPSDDLAAAWVAEINRRVADLDAGVSSTYAAEQVLAEMDADITASRANHRR